MKISQQDIDEVADSVGLIPSSIEEGENHSKHVYLERDIEGTSLYAMALMSVPEDVGPIRVFCGLYNAKNRVATDGEAFYDDLTIAIKAVDIRFNTLRMPYQPGSKRRSLKRKFLN